MTNELSDSEKIELLTAALVWQAAQFVVDEDAALIDCGRVARDVIRVIMPESQEAISNLTRRSVLTIQRHNAAYGDGEFSDAKADELELLDDGVDEALQLIEARLIAAGIDKGVF